MAVHSYQLDHVFLLLVPFLSLSLETWRAAVLLACHTARSAFQWTRCRLEVRPFDQKSHFGIMVRVVRCLLVLTQLPKVLSCLYTLLARYHGHYVHFNSTSFAYIKCHFVHQNPSWYIILLWLATRCLLAFFVPFRFLEGEAGGYCYFQIQWIKVGTKSNRLA